MSRLLLLALALCGVTNLRGQPSSPPHTVAFASFAPLNTDVFLADQDGSDVTPFLPHPASDYNASFSADGAWVVFTSERDGNADLYRAHPDGSGLERLVGGSAFDDQGALSPDGRSLAFVSTRSGQADLWILEIESGQVRNLTAHPGGDFRPAWSPDGHWIAFSSDRESQGPRGRGGFVTLHSTDLYLVRPDGTGLRRVVQATATQGVVGSPAWSPDGRRLVFYEAGQDEVNDILSARRLRGTTQVATLDVQTGERAVRTAGAGEKWSPVWLAEGRIAYVSGGPDGGIEVLGGAAGARGAFGSPRWSADGRRMVFHREREHAWPPFQTWSSLDPKFELLRTGIFPSYAPSGDRLVLNDETAGVIHNRILIQHADGSGRRVLFQDSVRSALGPVWSPRGEEIAFAFGRFFQSLLGPAVADIAVVRTDGTGLAMLTDGSGNYGFPSWSPDGRQIVYRSSGEGRSTLHIVDVETGETRGLTTGSAHDNFPCWSPTGERIAFTSDREGDYELYTVKPDGTDLRRLTHAAGNDSHCAWSPDGAWIAFTSARGGFKDEAVLHPYNPQPYGEIVVMRADGSDVRMLTDNQYEEGTPAWSGRRTPSPHN